MKLLTVITEAVLEKRLAHELETLGIQGYTVTDARGKGHRGDRNAAWEETKNIRVEVVCTESKALALADRFRTLFYDDYAMIQTLSDIAVLRPEKFMPD